jgi:hypothetical protein
MKDFTIESMLAILGDMLGWLLWAGLVLAVIVTVLFVLALLRQRGFKGRLARIALGIGLVGGIAVALLAPLTTQAGFDNIRGVIDWIFLALIAIAACASIAVTVFGLIGVVSAPSTRA